MESLRPLRLALLLLPLWGCDGATPEGNVSSDGPMVARDAPIDAPPPPPDAPPDGPPPAFCGDGVCNAWENAATCPDDCPPMCGDEICSIEAGELVACRMDCASECCVAGDGCGWACDGVCDCDNTYTWDICDCSPGGCCTAGDPCGRGCDGTCDCNGAFAWDVCDCGVDCCQPDDPCGLGCNGVCNCDGDYTWDVCDCGVDCCQPGDPCGLACDGTCQCDTETWDNCDCYPPDAGGLPEPSFDGGFSCCSSGDPCGWACDGWCDCPAYSWDSCDCGGDGGFLPDGSPIPDAGPFDAGPVPDGGSDGMCSALECGLCEGLCCCDVDCVAFGDCCSNACAVCGAC